MAVPAPAIPTGNAYTINVAHPVRDDSPLPDFAVAGALLLRRWKIPVRLHLSGDSPRLNTLRARLNEAGARPSAFSPAPSADVPGEGFWKTTMIVVEPSAMPGAPLFWAGERDDKKVDWDPLLIALGTGVSPDTLPDFVLRKPDLWIVTPTGSSPEQGQDLTGVEDVAWSYSRAGAGAVCVLHPAGLAWHTGSAVFGRSRGTRALRGEDDADAGLSRALRAGDAGERARLLGTLAAGVATGLMRDLLSENLFDKTLLRADRECLEMRPLRLGRAVVEGLAALHALPESSEAGAPSGFGTGPGKGFAERAEAHRVALIGPPSRPWAHKGR